MNCNPSLLGREGMAVCRQAPEWGELTIKGQEIDL